MTEQHTLQQRVDRLESQDAIRALVTAYAIACDEHDMPRLLSLFTEDACLDSPTGALVANGRDDIEALFIRTFKIRGPSYHWTHDVTVEIDRHDADRARGLVLCHAETCPNGVMSIAALRYEDIYAREGGRWRFSKRVLKFLYYVPVADFGNSLTQENRVALGDDRIAADFPEKLPAWQAFLDQHGPLQI